jgi:chloramphenicol 3-O-phosphotransferase
MAEKPAIPVIRAEDSRLKTRVSYWLNDNLKPSVNMIVIEGLPRSGKSSLQASLSLDDACKF